MDVKKIFFKAHEQFQKKKYDAALKLLEDAKKSLDELYGKVYSLEAAVFNERGNFVQEYYTLKKILPFLKFSSSEEKIFTSEIFFRVVKSCMGLFLLNEAAEFCLLAMQANQARNVSNLSITSCAIFSMNASEEYSAEDFHALYHEYKKILTDIKPYPKKFYFHKKIRIGFLSSDFHHHPIINWSWALLTKLDKNFFETYFYSSLKNPDKVTDYLRETAFSWRNIYDLTDEAAAKIIRADEIDILFDLSGHTTSNRLPVAAYRPASVQMSGIGYMNSTGLECFDYFLSDVYCAGDENYFVEKVIKLPHSHICYEPPTKLKPADFPPCLKNNFVIFGSFNRFEKITDSILITWKKILDAVPESKLILKHKIFDTSDGKNFVGERLKSFGFNLARIEMRGFSNKNHLVEYDDVDIALDTFPYTGGVTTCEALYMGVPVVSLYGDRHGSRFGLSILNNVGLEELAVASYDEYIQRAVMLANDWELLKILRKNLRTMMEKSPLMNSENYLREIQNVFIKILNEQKIFEGAQKGHR